MNKIVNDRKNLYFILIISIICIFSITIAYSALSIVLKIEGNAEVVASNWNIHLSNIRVSNGSVNGSVPTITSNTSATFSTVLTNPGDFYEFTIDVVNDGTIDAMIDSITKNPSLTDEQAKYINYVVEYESGESIAVKELVEAHSFVRLKVRVEFRKDVSTVDLPTSSTVLNLSFILNYVQSDNNGNVVVGNGKLLRVVDGNINTPGSEVCLGDECFYIIKNTGESVMMLSKYNLYVGYECSGNNNSLCVAYDNPTGLQDSSMLGQLSKQSVRRGTIDFSSSAYWNGSVQGSSYYIYNENSNLYVHLQNYLSLLTSKYQKNISDIRLITYDELYELGCDEVIEYSYLKCDEEDKWIYSSSYWIGSLAGENNGFWIVLSTNRYGYYADFYSKFMAGVRPVIEIPLSEF